MQRGRSISKGNVLMSIPGCLICWETITIQKKLGNTEKKTFLFNRLCSILKINLSTSTWDFGIEAFPFCDSCIKAIQQLSRLQVKLEEIQKEIETGIVGVKDKLLQSEHKFISTDLRVIGFRSQALEVEGPSVHSQYQNERKQSGIVGTPIQFQTHPSHSVPSKFDDFPATFPTPIYTLGNYSDVLPNVQNTQETIYSYVQNSIAIATPHHTYQPIVYSRTEPDHFENIGLVEVQVGFNPSTGNEDSHEMMDDSNDLNYEPSSASANGEEDQIVNCDSSQIEGNKKSSTSNSKQAIRSPRKTWMSGQKKLKATFRNRDIANAKIRSQSLQQNSQPKQVEQFSPIITTSDGRMFYESFEIMKNDKGTFYCGFCEYNKSKANSSVNITRMKIHIKGVHLDGYKCATCGKNYTSREHLSLHEKNIHLMGVNLTSCEICNKPIPDFSNNMQIHLWSHKNAQEKADGQAKGLEPREVVHWRMKRDDKFECPKCGKFFGRMKKLTAHLKSHLTPDGILKIELKSPDFKTVYENIEITKDANGLVCGMCGYNKPKGHTKETLTRMKDHIKGVHCGGFNCDICNKNFKSKGGLIYHEALHKGIPTKTPCEICQKPVSRSHKKIHLWTHKNEEEKAGSRQPKKTEKPRIKKYKCETCGKLYRRPCELKHHLKSHMASQVQKNYLPCPKCEKKFQSSIGLHNHFKMKHEPYGVKWFTCTTCDMKLINKSRYEIHIARCQHEYSCSICNRKFKFRSHLTLHTKNHPPAQDYKAQCKDCGLKTFTQKALLKHQMRNHHKDTDTSNDKTTTKIRIRKSTRLSAKRSDRSKGRYADYTSESETDEDDKIYAHPTRRKQISTRTENNQNSNSDDSALQLKSKTQRDSKSPGQDLKLSRMSISTAVKAVGKYQDEDYNPKSECEESISTSFSPQCSDSESDQDPDDAVVPLTSLPNCLFNAETINIISDELVSCVFPDGKMHLVSLVPFDFGPESYDYEEQEETFDDNTMNYDSEMQYDVLSTERGLRGNEVKTEPLADINIDDM